MTDEIYLRYHTEAKQINFGDDINPLLFRFFCRDKQIIEHHTRSTVHHDYEDKISILGMGSILGRVNSNDIVFGSGIIKDNTIIEIIPKQIICVRGPLTKKLLTESNIPCDNVIIGDPGLLIPFMIPPIIVDHNYKYDLGIIPHYIDNSTDIINKYKELYNVLIIDITNEDFTQFVKNICRCKRILSSSLHGIIVGDAYNVPSYHTVISDNVVGGSFKFRDYYESCGREYHDIPLDENCDLNNMFSQMKKYKCKISIEKLVTNFPFINEDIKNECLTKLNHGFMAHMNGQLICI